MHRYPNLGSGVSESLYDKIGMAVDLIVDSFRDRVCEAIEENGGRLDGIIDALVRFGGIASMRVITELPTSDVIDDKLKDEALKLYSSLFMHDEICGMELGISVSFVRRKKRKTDEQMFEEIFGKGVDKASAEKRLVAVYNGGGCVDLDSADSGAVIGWLKRELLEMTGVDYVVFGESGEDSGGEYQLR